MKCWRERCRGWRRCKIIKKKGLQYAIIELEAKVEVVVVEEYKYERIIG